MFRFILQILILHLKSVCLAEFAILPIAILISASSISPRNTALIVGGQASLSCRYGNSPLSWSFVSASGSQSSVVIATNCIVAEIFKPYFEVDNTDGSCSLIFNNVLLFHGGLYTCQEAVVLDLPKSAQFVVMGKM